MIVEGDPHPAQVVTAQLHAAGVEAERQLEKTLGLSTSESLYRSALDCMADAIHVADQKLRIVFLNQAFRRWNRELGLETDAVGRHIHEVFPFLPHETLDEYDHVFHTGQLLITEERLQVGGHELVTETRKIPVVVAGLVTQVITVVHDITTRKRTEEEREHLLAAEREQRLQAETLREVAAALNGSLDPQQVLPLILEQLARVVPYDSASIMLLSGEALKLVAYQSADPQRRPCPPLQVEALPHIQNVLTQRRPAIVLDTAQEPYWPQMPQSEYIHCWMGVPLVVQDKIIGLLNLNNEQANSYAERDAELAVAFATQSATAIRNARLFDDLQRSHAALAVERALLTQRVAERTADLSAANAELARAARLKDEFLASMSHELRTPLNAILGFTEALQEQVYGPLNERQGQALRSIERSGRHLLALINDILDISKIEAGKVELDVGPVWVGTTCQASLQLVLPDADKKRLRVLSTLDEGVIAQPILADERRLKQILVNMLTNAIKFTPEGGTVGLDVAGDLEQEAIRFTVWDSGIGMPLEDMHRLFQPFVQLDSSLARQFAGTGLGLSLLHRLARLHGGSVTLESSVGRGSCFIVSLPWEKAGQDLEHEGSKPGPLRPQFAGHALPSATIVFAADREVDLTSRSNQLAAEGYRVLAARSSAEAIQLAREEHPDLILLDMQLPGMDGVQVIRRIRAEAVQPNGPIPIIAITTLALPGDRERCLAVGANAYLIQPVSRRRMLTMIETYRRVAVG